MAGISIITRTKEGVLNNFESQEAPMWAIYDGSKPLDQCCDPDENIRRNRLTQILTFMEQGGSTAAFEIRYYDECGKNGKVTTQSPFFASLPFKVNDTANAMELINANKAGGANMQAPSNQFMMMLMDAKLENIKQQFDYALEKKEEHIRFLEEELAAVPEEEDGAMGMIGKIGAIGEKHPWMQDIVKDVVSTFKQLAGGITTKFHSMTERNAAQVSGIPKPDADPDNDKDLQELLSWSQKSLIHIFRIRHGVKFSPEGKVLAESQKQMKAADKEYVMLMVKLAEVADKKPKTFNSAIESLMEM